MTLDKHDQSLKEFGYIPGGYMWGNCQDCKQRLEWVAKYSTRCYPCAVKAKEAKESSPETPDKTLTYRGSGSDLATDIRAALSPVELVRLLADLSPVAADASLVLLDALALVNAYGEAMRERGERAESGQYSEPQWLEKVAESESAKAALLAEFNRLAELLECQHKVTRQIQSDFKDEMLLTARLREKLAALSPGRTEAIM